MPALKVWSEFFELSDGRSEVNIIQLDDLSFWFQFSHLAKLLDYSNPTVALKTHCEDYEIQKLDIGQHHPVNFVSESGFYSLVLGSQKPIARKFKKWICSEVLPKLRASGGYIMPSATSDQIQGLQKELAAMARRAGTLAIANQGYHLYDQVAYYFSCQEIIPRDQRSKFQRAFINWARQTKGVWIGKSVTYVSGAPSLLDQKADWLVSALLEFWRIREDWGRLLMTADYYGLV